jgi:hypothetical protein
MEPTNFDDFIKSNSKNDLPVPPELNWENMNFTLPPAKRKRRILPWMLFLLIGSLGIGSVLWYVYQQDINQSQSLSKNDPIGIQNQHSNSIPKKEDTFADKAQPQAAGENTITPNKLRNQDTFNIEPLNSAAIARPQDAGKQTVNRNNATNQEKFKTEPITRVDVAPRRDAGDNSVNRNKVTNQEKLKAERLARIDNVTLKDAGDNADNRDNVTNQEKLKTERPTRTATEGGKSIPVNRAAKSNDIAYTKAATPHQNAPSQPDSTEKPSQTRAKLPEPNASPNVVPVTPVQSTSSENKFAASPNSPADANIKLLRKPVSLLVSIGINKTQMNHNNARLNNAVTPAWGNSFQVLLERELKNNWLFSIGLGYQRLHTTFYFEKDLGKFVNAAELVVIRKTRQVFHNNYFDLISLNIGVGKQFQFSPRWNGQVLMYVSPTRRLNYTGRSLDDSESVVTYDPNLGSQKKWLLNADAAFRLSYKLKKTDLIMGFNLSQSLTKSELQSAGNSTTTVQPRVFGLNLGIRRTLGKQKK